MIACTVYHETVSSILSYFVLKLSTVFDIFHHTNQKYIVCPYQLNFTLAR